MKREGKLLLAKHQMNSANRYGVAEEMLTNKQRSFKKEQSIRRLLLEILV